MLQVYDLVPALSNFVRRLLRPVVAITLRNGITYRQFADLVKSVHVEVAGFEFAANGKPASTSRVAMLTGLTRRETARQRELLEGAEVASDRVHSTARVLAGWYSDPEFLSEDGKPRVLDPTEEEGFPALYRRYSGTDIPLSTMLKELVTVGAVARDEQGQVYPLTRYFRPAATDPHAIDRAGHVLSDLGQTIRYNIDRENDEPTRFEGRAWSAVVTEARAKEFRRFLEERGQAFLEDIDAWLIHHEDPGASPQSHVRFGAGVYEIRTLAADVPRHASAET